MCGAYRVGGRQTVQGGCDGEISGPPGWGVLWGHCQRLESQYLGAAGLYLGCGDMVPCGLRDVGQGAAGSLASWQCQGALWGMPPPLVLGVAGLGPARGPCPGWGGYQSPGDPRDPLSWCQPRMETRTGPVCRHVWGQSPSLGHPQCSQYCCSGGASPAPPPRLCGDPCWACAEPPDWGRRRMVGGSP